MKFGYIIKKQCYVMYSPFLYKKSSRILYILLFEKDGFFIVYGIFVGILQIR